MPTRVLFVDDQPELLDGLRRSLRPMRAEWDMKFACGGAEALSVLGEWPADIVVSDMRMPTMSGAELLCNVAKLYPQTLRIMLSGQCDEETVLAMTGVVHAYLSKPCPPETLRATIERMRGAQQPLSDPEIVRLVLRTNVLPSMPRVFLELVQLLQSPDASLREIETLMAQDVAMTCKLLQIVNSSYFGLPYEVKSASRAAALLGLNRLRSLVLVCGVFTRFTQKTEGISLDDLMDHSLATATLAEKIVGDVAPGRAEMAVEAGLAGVVHEVGRLLLLQHRGPQYRAAMVSAMKERIPLWDAEAREFTIGHAHLGASLLRLWGLSDSISQAVAWQHSPLENPDRTFGVAAALHLADALDGEHRHVPDQPPRSELNLEYVRELGLADRLTTWRKMAPQKSMETVT